MGLMKREIKHGRREQPVLAKAFKKDRITIKKRVVQFETEGRVFDPVQQPRGGHKKLKMTGRAIET